MDERHPRPPPGPSHARLRAEAESGRRTLKQAIGQLDAVTQQNSAMVEELAAASLQSQSTPMLR